MSNECKFCKQTIILDNENLTEIEAAEAATMACKCDLGESYRNRSHKLDLADTKIEEMFHDIKNNETIILIKQISEMVYDEDIKKGELEITSQCKVAITKIQSKGKDDIKIKRTDKEVDSVEV